MKFNIYVMDGHQIDIRPAPVERDWMDATHERFAYRCLPLNIANSHGWEILCPSSFTASWNGETGLDAVEIAAEQNAVLPAISHFGFGVLTFHVPCLFQTEEGYDLMVGGPVNMPKDGIAPLTGIIETDWSPYTFTMNWKFTRPGSVSFAKGEPFCHVFPVKRGAIEAAKPEIHVLSEHPALEEQYQQWDFIRNAFIIDLNRGDPKATSEKWQKLYYRGLDADGKKISPQDHRTRVRLKPFTRSMRYVQSIKPKSKK